MYDLSNLHSAVQLLIQSVFLSVIRRGQVQPLFGLDSGGLELRYRNEAGPLRNNINIDHYETVIDNPDEPSDDLLRQCALTSVDMYAKVMHAARVEIPFAQLDLTKKTMYDRAEKLVAVRETRSFSRFLFLHSIALC